MQRLEVILRWFAGGVLSLLSVVSSAQTAALDIVQSARKQIGVTVKYDPAYEEIRFPGGDVPISRGVCTDVVVRAFRDARKLDLQLEINKDMTANRSLYPKKWGIFSVAPNPHIDHRRVPNIMVYLERKAVSVAVSPEASKYLPGDIVAWKLGTGRLHIGVVTEKKSPAGQPLVIHNISVGAVEEDILMRYQIIGHYRVPLNLKS